MFSFFKATPATPFDACPAFEKIRPLILSLFAKETQLKNTADTPNSNSNKKYRVISNLCNNIRRLQNDFNQASKENNAGTTLQIRTFADELSSIIKEMLSDYGHTLKQHRDVKKREVARKAIDVGAHAAVIAPIVSLGVLSPLIAGTSIAFGTITGVTSLAARPIRQGLYSAMGLRKQTKSMELIYSLQLALKEIVQDFNLELNLVTNDINEKPILRSLS